MIENILSGIVLDIILDGLKGTAAFAAAGVTQLISFNNNTIDSLFSNSAVTSFLSLVEVLGSILFLFGVGFSFADWAVKKQDNISDSVMDTFKNMFLGFFALLGFISIPILLIKFTNEICLQLTSNMSSDTMKYFWDEITTLEFSSSSPFDIVSTYWTKFLELFYVIIMFVCVVRLFFANIKRGGILLILIFICPFHLFSVPRGYTDSFFSWCKQVIGLCITAFIQNFLVTLSFVAFAFSGNMVFDMVVSAGVALSAFEAPRILTQFGLDTSMRTNVSQAIYGVSGAMNILRAFK